MWIVGIAGSFELGPVTEYGEDGNAIDNKTLLLLKDTAIDVGLCDPFGRDLLVYDLPSGRDLEVIKLGVADGHAVVTGLDLPAQVFRVEDFLTKDVRQSFAGPFDDGVDSLAEQRPDAVAYILGQLIGVFDTETTELGRE